MKLTFASAGGGAATLALKWLVHFRKDECLILDVISHLATSAYLTFVWSLVLRRVLTYPQITHGWCGLRLRLNRSAWTSLPDEWTDYAGIRRHPADLPLAKSVAVLAVLTGQVYLGAFVARLVGFMSSSPSNSPSNI